MWVLLLGAPGETPETLRETFETMRHVAGRTEPVFVNVGIRAYNGAPIAEQMKARDPACTNDAFLRPVGYRPDAMSLASIHLLARLAAFDYTNLIVRRQQACRRPGRRLRAAVRSRLGQALARANMLHRAVGMFLRMRDIEKKSGMRAVRKRLFLLKNHESLRAAMGESGRFATTPG